jgi:hypothetical protein
MSSFVIVKFRPDNVATAKPASDPLTVYPDFGSAEAAATALQQGLVDGSQFAICQAVAMSSFANPPVTITLLGGTVPTTV